LISTIAETKDQGRRGPKLQLVRLDQGCSGRKSSKGFSARRRAKEAELKRTKAIAARRDVPRAHRNAARADVGPLIHQLNAHTIGGVIRAGDGPVNGRWCRIPMICRSRPKLQAERHRPGAERASRPLSGFSALQPAGDAAVDRARSPMSRPTPRRTSRAARPISRSASCLPEEERRRAGPGLQLSSGMPGGSVHADRQPDHAELSAFKADPGISFQARFLSSGRGANTGRRRGLKTCHSRWLSLISGSFAFCPRSQASP